ncbi:hypothetical protein J3E64_001541 [Sphingobium sp. OAS761]|uniref:plasmid mobilization relaxosome protein MobC n=1 Tax=Sphingobium sp. OAS761 TaxID=2817901 RepID=UPI00209CB40F|nr:plasmid mobilization relaxosome protein MobC [Sphingobium sp. OAS761]MCP1469859.1 hypothetical protein [Sphingobium sp. OAS761]
MTEPKRIRPAPKSVRVEPEKWSRWTAAAAGMPMNAFIIACVDYCIGLPSLIASKILTDDDHRALTKAHAALGAGRIPNNLNQIAKALNEQALIMSPDVEADLKEACGYVISIGRIFHKVAKSMRWRP